MARQIGTDKTLISVIGGRSPQRLSEVGSNLCKKRRSDKFCIFDKENLHIHMKNTYHLVVVAVSRVSSILLLL